VKKKKKRTSTSRKHANKINAVAVGYVDQKTCHYFAPKTKKEKDMNPLRHKEIQKEIVIKKSGHVIFLIANVSQPTTLVYIKKKIEEEKMEGRTPNSRGSF